MVKPVTAVVIGGGKRGQAYSSYALDEPEKFKVRKRVNKNISIRINIACLTIRLTSGSFS